MKIATHLDHITTHQTASNDPPSSQIVDEALPPRLLRHSMHLRVRAVNKALPPRTNLECQPFDHLQSSAMLYKGTSLIRNHPPP